MRFQGIATPSGTEIDPYSISRDGSIPLTANWNATYNITFGAGNGIKWTDILEQSWLLKADLVSYVGNYSAERVAIASNKVFAEHFNVV